MIDLESTELPEPTEEENKIREQRFQEYRKYVHGLPAGEQPIGYFAFVESLERKENKTT
jgi:hypothetical protein